MDPEPERDEEGNPVVSVNIFVPPAIIGVEPGEVE